MAINGTILSITANDTTQRFDVAVRYSDGTNVQDEVISVDPVSSAPAMLSLAQKAIVDNGKKYVSIFAKRTAYNLGVAGYQQYVGQVVAVA